MYKWLEHVHQTQEVDNLRQQQKAKRGHVKYCWTSEIKKKWHPFTRVEETYLTLPKWRETIQFH